MAAPLSVVIPVLDAAGDLGPALGALGEGLMAGLVRDLVIADGGSGDGIEAVAEGLGAQLVLTEPGRGTQLAAGCRAATGHWMMILHADTVLPPGWSESVRAHMARAPGCAGYFGLSFDSAHPMAGVTAGWGNLRSRLFALPYGDQALVLSRALYEAAGGYPEIPLMEDVALVRRLGRGRLCRLPGRVTTSAARYESDGWVARGFRNLSTYALYRCGVPPERLAARYRGTR